MAYDVVGGRVGEGTFGVVRTATRKADGERVVVKYCNPKEAQIADVAEELALFALLAGAPEVVLCG